MQILILIALGTFFVLGILFFIFYIKVRNERDKMASNLSLLNKKYQIAVQDLKKPAKKGYYKSSINLVLDKEKNIT